MFSPQIWHNDFVLIIIVLGKLFFSYSLYFEYKYYCKKNGLKLEDMSPLDRGAQLSIFYRMMLCSLHLDMGLYLLFLFFMFRFLSIVIGIAFIGIAFRIIF